MTTMEPTPGRAADLSEPPVLSAAMRERVGTLHTRAEKTGIVQDVLKGRASRAGYALLLRNLLPAYAVMERALDLGRTGPVLAELANPKLYRAAAIARDLDAIEGRDWAGTLPLLAAAETYAARVESAAAGDGALLIAHAYTRYVGDLSGGQIMRRLLARSLNLPDAALGLYSFPDLGDVDAFKAGYRDAIDRAGRRAADPAAVIEEAAIAFALNIDVSVAVQDAVATHPC